MRYLVDAHAILWSQDDVVRLSPRAAATMTDPAHDRLISIATVWEIGIKVSIGNLKTPRLISPTPAGDPKSRNFQ